MTNLKSNKEKIEVRLNEAIRREVIRRKQKEIMMAKMKHKYEGREFVVGTRQELHDMGYFLTKREKESELQRKFEEMEMKRLMTEVGCGDKDEKRVQGAKRKGSVDARATITKY